MERDVEDRDIRIVRQIKNSLAPSDGEICFSITAEASFRWLECRAAKHPAQKVEPIQFESKTEKALYLIKMILERGDSSIRN